MIMLIGERVMKIFYAGRRTTLPIFIFLCTTAFAITLTGNLLSRTWSSGIPIFIIYVLTTLLPPLILSLNYKSLLTKRFAATACVYLLVNALASWIPLVFRAFFPDVFRLYGSFIQLAAFVIVYLTAVLMLKNFKHISSDVFNRPDFWIPILIIPSFSFTALGLSLLQLPLLAEVYAILNYLGVVFFTFYMYNTLAAAYEDRLKSAIQAQEREYYFTQCQLMQESVEQIKSIRHDMKVHLAAIKGYTSGIQEATDYLNGLLDDISGSEAYSDTGNIAFDSIINFKLKNAKAGNINLELRLLIPPALNIEVPDIVTILGNLLDNALDAVAKTTEKLIKLDIEYSRGSLFIQVQNTFDGIVKYVQGSSEDEKRLATRKSTGEHGYGLTNIQKSADKYNGQVDITHDDNMFSVTLLLYVP